MNLPIGNPPSAAAAMSFSRCATESEFASPVVPNGASPSQPLARSHRQCATKAARLGSSSAVKGVSTAA